MYIHIESNKLDFNFVVQENVVYSFFLLVVQQVATVPSLLGIK